MFRVPLSEDSHRSNYTVYIRPLGTNLACILPFNQDATPRSYKSRAKCQLSKFGFGDPHRLLTLLITLTAIGWKYCLLALKYSNASDGSTLCTSRKTGRLWNIRGLVDITSALPSRASHQNFIRPFTPGLAFSFPTTQSAAA